MLIQTFIFDCRCIDSSHDVSTLRLLLTTESVGERLENGLTLLHLCCISPQSWKLFTEREGSKMAALAITPTFYPPSSSMCLGTQTTETQSSCVLKLPGVKLKEKNKLIKKASAKIHAKLEAKIAEELSETIEVDNHKKEISSNETMERKDHEVDKIEKESLLDLVFQCYQSVF